MAAAAGRDGRGFRSAAKSVHFVHGPGHAAGELQPVRQPQGHRRVRRPGHGGLPARRRGGDLRHVDRQPPAGAGGDRPGAAGRRARTAHARRADQASRRPAAAAGGHAGGAVVRGRRRRGHPGERAPARGASRAGRTPTAACPVTAGTSSARRRSAGRWTTPWRGSRPGWSGPGPSGGGGRPGGASSSRRCSATCWPGSGPAGHYWDASAGKQPLIGVTERPPVPGRPYTVLVHGGHERPAHAGRGAGAGRLQRLRPDRAGGGHHAAQRAGGPGVPVAGHLPVERRHLVRARGTASGGTTSQPRSRSAAGRRRCCSWTRPARRARGPSGLGPGRAAAAGPVRVHLRRGSGALAVDHPDHRAGPAAGPRPRLGRAGQPALGPAPELGGPGP